MILYFLRHGLAEDVSADGTDASRRLTPEGITRMRTEATGLAALRVRPDLILTSPLLRALETAAIVADTLGLPSPTVRPELASGRFHARELSYLLASVSARSEIMLVGHEPDFSSTVQELCGAMLELKKGGLAVVEIVRPEPGQGVLRWLLGPKHLEALGR